MTLSTSSK